MKNTLNTLIYWIYCNHLMQIKSLNLCGGLRSRVERLGIGNGRLSGLVSGLPSGTCVSSSVVELYSYLYLPPVVACLHHWLFCPNLVLHSIFHLTRLLLPPTRILHSPPNQDWVLAVPPHHLLSVYQHPYTWIPFELTVRSGPLQLLFLIPLLLSGLHLLHCLLDDGLPHPSLYILQWLVHSHSLNLIHQSSLSGILPSLIAQSLLQLSLSLLLPCHLKQ